jgi:hypothetical protein
MVTGFFPRRRHRPTAAITALCVMGAFAPACTPRGQAPLPYPQRVQALRDAKDRFFATSEGGKRWMTVPLEGEFDRLTSGRAREFSAAHQAAVKP